MDMPFYLFNIHTANRVTTHGEIFRLGFYVFIDRSPIRRRDDGRER